MGNPAPLAFFALAAGTLTLSGMQLGWVAATEGKDVALVLIGCVFPLQLLASIFAFLARDGAAGEGFGLLAGSWLVIGLVTITSPPGVTSSALGIFLLAVSLLLSAPACAKALRKNMAAAVLAGAAIRFTATGIYELTASRGWENVAGVLGLVLFALAFYAGLALTLTGAGRGPSPLDGGSYEPTKEETSASSSR